MAHPFPTPRSSDLDRAPQNRSRGACRRAGLSSGERWIRRTGLRQAQPERKKKNMTTAASSTFVNIGERTNVTGSAAFKKLILADDYAAAVEVARQPVENGAQRSEEHTSELQSLMRISYAVFCLKHKNTMHDYTHAKNQQT